MPQPPDVSVVVANWNTSALLERCLDSIGRTRGSLSVEIIVVDNASTDDSVAIVRRTFPDAVLIVNETNAGFAAASNQGLSAARGRYLLLLNSDAELTDGALSRAVAFMEVRTDVGIAGGALIGADGVLQSSYADFPTLLSECLSATGLGSRFLSPQFPSPRLESEESVSLVGWIPGAFMLVRRDVFDTIGGMDESFWMYSEDTDWCYRAHQRGWTIAYLADVRVLHAGGASTRQRRADMLVRLYSSKVRFFAKHYGTSRAAMLRTLLWTIFAGRTFLCQVMLIVAPGDRERWTRELDRSRLVRTAFAAAPASRA